MLDALAGQIFEAGRPNDSFTQRFTVTAVSGQMAHIVDAEDHESTVSVWSLLHGLHTAAILPERGPAPSVTSRDVGASSRHSALSNSRPSGLPASTG